MTGVRPPGPRGEGVGLLNDRLFRTDIFGFLSNLAGTYGDIVGFDLGRTPCILVNAAAPVRELFFGHEADLRKPEFVSGSNRGHWGDGLTTLEGPDWHARRAVLRPSFRPGAVVPRLDVVAECTRDMLGGWTPDEPIDLSHEIRLLTARIAARTVMDADVEGYGDVSARAGLLPYAEAYGEDFTSAPGGDAEATLVMVRPRAPRQMARTVALIEDRLAGGEDRGDVLSALVRARLPGGRALGRDAILGEVVQMLYAGHLTVPLSLLAYWRAIAGDPAVVDRIAAESDRVCARAVPTQAVLARSLAMAALKEAMRLDPPAPILYRAVETPFELGGYAFSTGDAVWVSPRLLHRDPRYFDEPDRFLPERFLSGRLPPEARASFLPFGAGPRTCIASQQALHQMTLIALMAARHVALSPLAGDDRRFRVTMRA